MNLKRGFTLVELLVVISIIGILVGVVAVNANTARRQSRDAKRKADIQNVAGALELYRAANHAYPTGANNTYNSQTFAQALSVFTSNIPSDPSGAKDGDYTAGGYYYSSDGSKFVLDARLENSAETDTISGGITSPTSASDPNFYRTGVYHAAGNPPVAHYRVAGP